MAPKVSEYLDDYSSAAKGLTGVGDSLAQRVDALAQSYQEKFGEPLKLTSAQRSTEHQARLYEQDVAAHGGRPSGYVARPGNSSHETGAAIDIDKAQANRIPDAVLTEVGLHRPLKGQGKSGVNEPWHLQEASAVPAVQGPKKWHPDELRVMADQAADRHGVPKDIFRALIGHESAGWKVDAANPKSSALGIAQFLDSTSDDYQLGLKVFPRGKGGKFHPDDERLNPEKALDAAARLLLKKPGATWRDRVKNYGEGTDEYVGRVMAQWEKDKLTPPSNNEIRLASGLPAEPVPPEPMSTMDRVTGSLRAGVGHAITRYGQLSENVFGPGAPGVAAVHGAEPIPVTSGEMSLARKELEGELMGESGKAVTADPATSWPGWIAESLLQMAPELPLFSSVGKGVEMGMGAASLLPKIGPYVGKAAAYMTPEAIKAASVIGSIPRLAAHGAALGGAMGLTTGPEGERLESAGEEALGFAIAAPAFHLAGKALLGIGKGLGKAFLKLPENFHTLEAAEKKFDVKQYETRAMAKEVAEPGDLVRKVEGKWAVLKAKEGMDAPVTDVPAEQVAGPSFGSVEEGQKFVETNTAVSGAPLDLVADAKGNITAVPDYSGVRKIAEGKSKAQGLPAEEIGKMFPEPVEDTGEVDILAGPSTKTAVTDAAKMAEEIFGKAEVTPTLVEEVRAAQGGKREAVPLRSNLNEAASVAGAELHTTQLPQGTTLYRNGEPISKGAWEHGEGVTYYGGSKNVADQYGSPEATVTYKTPKPLRLLNVLDDSTIETKTASARAKQEGMPVSDGLRVYFPDGKIIQTEKLPKWLEANGYDGHIDHTLKERVAKGDLTNANIVVNNTRAEELSITVSPRGEVKAEVVRASKSLERDRVHVELDASYPRAAEAPQELVVIKALHEASAKRFERLGQGTREDYYKGKSFKLGEQLEGYNEAFYQKDGKFVTEFMPSANISTAFHAAWHYIENTLPKDYIAELSKWRGKDYSAWETADFEHTARAFERFWAEGRVSQRALQEIGIDRKVAKIFAELKSWMLDFYADLKGSIKGSDIDVELNPQLENIFRKALGLKELKEAKLPESRDIVGSLQEKINLLGEQFKEASEKFGKFSPEATAIRMEAEGVAKELTKALEKERSKVPEPVAEALEEGKVAPTVPKRNLVKEYEAAMDRYFDHDDLGSAEALEAKAVAEVVKIEMDQKGVLYQSQDSAKELYQKAGHLDAFTRDAETLQNWDLEQKSPDQKKVLFQAASGRATKAERLATEQARKAKLDADTTKAFTEQVGRANTLGAKVMDLARVWDYPPEEVTKHLKKGELTSLALESGMDQAGIVRLAAKLGVAPEAAEKMTLQNVVDLAGKTNKEMDLYRSLFEHIRDRWEQVKSPDLDSVKAGDIPSALAEMSKINDTIESWHKSFSENAPSMLRELPTESLLKGVGSWIEDRLGYSPKALDRYTKAAYEAFVNMQHLARRYTVLRPLQQMGWKMGATIKEIEKGLLEGDTDAAVKGWAWGVDTAGKQAKVARDVRLPGIKAYSDLRGARPELANIADKMLLAADKNPKASPLSAEGALAKLEGEKLPLADKLKIAQAVGDVRETLDYTYFKLREQYQGSLEGHTEKSIAARMRAWDGQHEYHPNYFPHVREGKLVVMVKDPSTGETLYSTRVDGGRKLAQMKEKLKADYPGMDVGDFTAQQKSRGGVSGLWLTQFATNLEQQAARDGNSKAVQPFIDMVRKTASEFGLRGHYIARSSAEGIPGFEENVGKALIGYGKMFASHMGKTEFVQGAAGEIASLKGYGRIQDYARRWVELGMQPSNQLDNVIATAKNVAFMKYIGGVLKTAVVTTFDKITNAYPMMGMYVDNPKALMLGGYRDGAKFMKWERDVGKHLEGLRSAAQEAGVPFNELEGIRASRDAVALPGGIEPWIKEGILRARKSGQLDPVFTDIILEGHRTKMDLMGQKMDMTGTAESYLKHGWNKSLEWSGKLIGTTESYGRLTTMISAMRMFKQLGFAEADAVAAGGRFMLDAHGYYGKMNLPLWMQERGAGQLAKLPFTFRVFEHHYINLIGALLTGQQGKAGRVAAAKSLGLLAGLGGMMSLPFFATTGKLFREATGTDPEQYVRKQLNNIDNSQTLADMFSYGVPASGLGVGTPAISLRSSTEVGKVRADELLLGAPGAVIGDVAKGVSGAMSGDWNQFFDAVAPSVLKNPKKAYERYYYGALSASGKKLTEGVGGPELKYTAGESIGQAVGFTPSKMEKSYQQSEVAIADREYWAGQRKTLYSRLQRAFNTGDEDKMESIFQDIAAYNQKASSMGGDVTLITPQEIRQSLRDRIEKKKLQQAARLGMR